MTNLRFPIRPPAPIATVRGAGGAASWRPLPGDAVVVVDPALRTSGWSLWVLSRENAHDVATLHAAGDVHNTGNATGAAALIYASCLDVPAFRAAPRAWCICERMQDYKAKAARAAALDDVRAVVDAVSSRWPTVSPWTPNTWKGQVPKEVHHRRLRAAFPGLPEVGPDGMDAIGLGLFAFGLVGRGGVRRGA